jgi:hypothetical protein
MWLTCTRAPIICTSCHGFSGLLWYISAKARSSAMPRLKSHPIGAASCLTSSMNALLNIGTQRAFRFFSSCVIKLEIEILRIITHCTCAGSRTLRRCFGQCYHPLHPFGKLADWLRLIMSKNCGVYLSAPALLITHQYGFPQEAPALRPICTACTERCAMWHALPDFTR